MAVSELATGRGKGGSKSTAIGALLASAFLSLMSIDAVAADEPFPAEGGIAINNGNVYVNSGVVSFSTSVGLNMISSSGAGGSNIINTGTVIGTKGLYINPTEGGSSGTISSIDSIANIGGTIASTGSNPAIEINNATLTGSVSNTGLIQTQSAAGIALYVVNSNIITNITNTPGAIIGGAITNNVGSSISGISYGINAGNSTIAGSISNAGMIQATSTTLGIPGVGISLVNSTLSESIINTADATIVGGSRGVAIALEGSTIGGGIANAGAITAGNTGIAVSNSGLIVGNISNSGLIQGSGGSGFGVALGSSSLGGSIVNAAGGTISGGATNGVGVRLNASTIAGSITNAGTIAARTGIYIDATSAIQNGITNTGLISASGSVAINNAGTISAAGQALAVSSGTVIGGISNAGLIQASTSSGLYISSSSVGGSLTNAS
ncbi:beta strand repeat-containing protein, partial [Polynucleobacter sphagniphilus]